MNSNRCPECGGIANHLVTDIDGKTYYHCNTGLTTFERDGTVGIKVSRIVSCDTIINQHRAKYTGTIAYVGGGRTRTLAVTNGKERR